MIKLANDAPNQRTEGPLVVVADDSDAMRQLVAASLRREGYSVLEARDGRELVEITGSAYTRGSTGGPDLVISDVRMPGWTGLQALAGLRESDWKTPVILMTGFGDLKTHAEASRLGAVAVLDKPFDIEVLVTLAKEVAPTASRDTATKKHVLVADGNSDRRSLIAYSLRLAGYHVTECRDVNDVASRLGSRVWFAVVADSRMDDFEFVRQPLLEAVAAGEVFLLNARAAGEAPDRPQSDTRVHRFVEGEPLSDLLGKLTTSSPMMSKGPARSHGG